MSFQKFLIKGVGRAIMTAAKNPVVQQKAKDIASKAVKLVKK